MKTSILTVSIIGLGVTMAVLPACQTASPGVKNVAGTYSVMLDGTPDKVTKAAQKAAEDLKLANINATSTKVDGKVTATTAQNTDVMINIEQAGDNVSRVSVRVGASGDGDISQQLIDRTKSNLHWF